MQRLDAIEFLHAETSATEIEHRQAVAIFKTGAGGEQRVATFFEQRVFGYRARCDDAHHLPIHRAFAGRRIADLFADRHRLTEAHQLGQVLIDRVHRHAAHRNRLAGRLSACRQRDIEQLRRALRIAVKQLVEIAHAVKQQNVRMLGLDAQELLHHRRVCAGIFGGRGHRAGVYRKRLKFLLGSYWGAPTLDVGR